MRRQVFNQRKRWQVLNEFQKTNCVIIELMSKPLFFVLLATGWLTLGASASVVVTKFDPPLAVSASADAPDNLPFNVISVDFNLDGKSDFVLGYGQGAINCYFNATNQVFIKIAADPGGYTIYQCVGSRCCGSVG
jgi:hypothetical protein